MQGIPPIPATLAETANRYTEFRAARLASWHPIDRQMLISTRFGDATQIHQVRFPLGGRKQLTFFPEPLYGSSYQPTTGEYFVFSKDIGGCGDRIHFDYGDVPVDHQRRFWGEDTTRAQR